MAALELHCPPPHRTSQADHSAKHLRMKLCNRTIYPPHRGTRPAVAFLSLCLMHGHEHPMAWPQGKNWIGFDWVAGDQMQAVLLRNRRQHEGGFQHGELVANALPRAATER